MQQWGRRTTPWNDTNKGADFKVLGGCWDSNADLGSHPDRHLASKPTQHKPPSSAYTDEPDECSVPLSARGRPYSRGDETGTDMAGIFNFGGTFDMRASMGAPCSKPNQLRPSSGSAVNSAWGAEPEEPSKRFHRGKFSFEDIEDGAAVAMGMGGAWQVPQIHSGGRYGTPEYSAQPAARLRHLTPRPLSAKPGENRLRESQVLGGLHERMASMRANRTRAQSTVPW